MVHPLVIVLSEKICTTYMCLNKKNDHKWPFEFYTIYQKRFCYSKKQNYYTTFLAARQLISDIRWVSFFRSIHQNYSCTTEKYTLTINKWLSMETGGNRGTVSGWAVFLAMVVLKLATLSSDGRIQALIIRRAKSAKYGVPHPL